MRALALAGIPVLIFASYGIVRADEPTRVTITVRTATGELVPGAIVKQVAPTPSRILGATGTSGSLLVVSLPIGSSIEAESDGGASPVVRVTGSIVDLTIKKRTIAFVTSHPVGTTALSETNSLAVAAGGSSAALQFVPNYRTQEEGGSGRSQLNGIEMDLPALAHGGSSAFGIPDDLVSSVSPDQADDGSVTPNFHILSPTQEPASSFRLGLTSDAGALWKFDRTGSLSRFRYAFAFAGGGDDGSLANESFTDTSGMDYDHSSHYSHRDASASLSYAFDPDTTVSFVGYGTRYDGRDIQSIDPGDTPIGFGPGNESSGDQGFEYAILSHTHGSITSALIDSRFDGSGANDDENGVTDMQPDPSMFLYDFHGRFDQFSERSPFANGSVEARLSQTQSAVTTDDGLSDLAPADSAQSTAAVDANINLHRLSLSADLNGNAFGGAFQGSILGASLGAVETLGATRATVKVMRSPAQTLLATTAKAYSYGAFAQSQYTCAPSYTATTQGPAEIGDLHPVANTISSQIDRQISHGSLEAGGFVSETSNAIIPVIHSAGGLTGAEESQFAAVGDAECSDEGAPLQIFAQSYMTVPSMLSREWYLTGTRYFGRFQVRASYETYSSYATSGSDPSTNTTFAIGRQLLNVPLHHSSMIVGYQLNDITLAGGVNMVSSNNALNIGSYATLSGGIVVKAGRGSLELSVQNLSKYDERFSTAAMAAMFQGSLSPIPTLAQPLYPQWKLFYTFSPTREERKPQ